MAARRRRNDDELKPLLPRLDDHIATLLTEGKTMNGLRMNSLTHARVRTELGLTAPKYQGGILGTLRGLPVTLDDSIAFGQIAVTVKIPD